ncbi:MAG: hypothetical protein M3134_08415, partial [Actinomycetota bacterium]|nr:hypothetical protein [Actinomycetota bacterium]
MRLRSARACVAATCALATSVAGIGVAGAATTYGPPTPTPAAAGWTGEDKRVERTRATFPEDRYALAGGCYAIKVAGGGFVQRSGDGFAATAPTA